MAKRRKREPRGERAARQRGARSDARGDLGWALGLTLLAWAHRLAFLFSNQDRSWPFTVFYEGDAEAFYGYARAILSGSSYDNGLPFHPPGFPYFLAGLYAFLGAGADGEVPHRAVKEAMALLGAASVGLLYLLVRPYLGRTGALVAGLLAAWHFGLYVLAVAPVSEGLYLLLLLLALLVWSRRLAHPLAAPGAVGAVEGGPWTALGLGALLGLLALTRAEGALVALLLAGVGAAGALRQRASFRPWALVAAGWALAVAPWAACNAIHLADFNRQQAAHLAEPLPTFVPLTLYGPLNLALANHPAADGSFSRAFLASSSSSPTLDLSDPEHLRFFLHGGAMAWDWARQHPGDFGRLVLRKWALSAEAWKLGWTQWDWPGGLAGVRRPVDVFVPASGLALALAPPVAVLGLLACFWTPGGPRRWAGVVLLLGFSWLLTTGLFFGYVRQGLLLLFFGLTFAAAGLLWLGRRLAHPRGTWEEALPFASPFADGPGRHLLQGLGAAALLLLALELAGAAGDRNFRATGTTLPGQPYLDRDQPVVLEPVK